MISSMTNKILSIWFLFFCLISPVKAQDITTLVFGKNAKSNYIGQYKDNHKQKNGMGILRFRKNALYVGDFSDNKMSGKGIIFAGKEELANIPGTSVFVGNLINGKKERNGICYAANGDIIYKGNFINDKPVSTYPQLSPDQLSYFTMLEWGEELYWGEVTQGTPNGSALVMQEDGSFWYGNYVAGEKNGICITIWGEDSWEVGKWENNQYTRFNSSDQVASRRQLFVAAKKALHSELRNQFWDVAMGVTESAMNIAVAVSNAKNRGVDSSAASGDGVSLSNPSYLRRDKGIVSSSKSSCGTAWMTESRVYSDYESQLITRIKDMSASDVSSIKEKMRNIRLKWEKRGCIITKSPHE